MGSVRTLMIGSTNTLITSHIGIVRRVIYFWRRQGVLGERYAALVLLASRAAYRDASPRV